MNGKYGINAEFIKDEKGVGRYDNSDNAYFKRGSREDGTFL